MRALEVENQRLKALVGMLSGLTFPGIAPEADVSATVAGPAAARLDGRRVLYVGGEETLQALDGLVDRADVVFCPIDCVSHQACLKVTSLCRRRAKPFVPLRNSSATCFLQAMRRLQSAAAPGGLPAS
jgi:hypothetical protein